MLLSRYIFMSTITHKWYVRIDSIKKSRYWWTYSVTFRPRRTRDAPLSWHSLQTWRTHITKSTRGTRTTLQWQTPRLAGLLFSSIKHVWNYIVQPNILYHCKSFTTIGPYSSYLYYMLFVWQLFKWFCTQYYSPWTITWSKIISCWTLRRCNCEVPLVRLDQVHQEYP